MSIVAFWQSFGGVTGRCLAAIRDHLLSQFGNHSGISFVAAWLYFDNITCRCLVNIRESHVRFPDRHSGRPWPLPGQHSGTSLASAWLPFGALLAAALPPFKCLAVNLKCSWSKRGRQPLAFLAAVWPPCGNVTGKCLVRICERLWPPLDCNLEAAPVAICLQFWNSCLAAIRDNPWPLLSNISKSQLAVAWLQF